MRARSNNFGQFGADSLQGTIENRGAGPSADNSMTMSALLAASPRITLTLMKCMNWASSSRACVDARTGLPMASRHSSTAIASALSNGTLTVSMEWITVLPFPSRRVNDFPIVLGIELHDHMLGEYSEPLHLPVLAFGQAQALLNEQSLESLRDLGCGDKEADAPMQAAAKNQGICRWAIRVELEGIFDVTIVEHRRKRAGKYWRPGADFLCPRCTFGDRIILGANPERSGIERVKAHGLDNASREPIIIAGECRGARRRHEIRPLEQQLQRVPSGHRIRGNEPCNHANEDRAYDLIGEFTLIAALQVDHSPQHGIRLWLRFRLGDRPVDDRTHTIAAGKRRHGEAWDHRSGRQT